ncbi:MAG: carbohydrate ABC transporter permease [Phycisphaerales bacterium]|nr:carbohydrate ABC transporter permease [Phycisphaerales bacterium]
MTRQPTGYTRAQAAVARRARAGQAPSATSQFFIYAALTIGAALLLFPLWWMIVVSLSSPLDAARAAVSAEGFSLIPTDPHWGNYPAALEAMGARKWESFYDALANTIVLCTLTVIGQVLSCSLCGYAFARLRFRGREPLFILMLATMMLPAQVTMIPLFILFRTLGWINSLAPLIVPTFFGNAFYIFMFRQFFAQIPEALVEAARIDGCGYLGVWARIMLPLCRPVIAITAIFTFMFFWNDFLGPLIYLQSEEKYTLAVALNSFRNQYGGVNEVHQLMAASIVTIIPCVALFFVAQRHFVGGLSLGAVKG